MKDPKKLFHNISYLQYPLLLIGLYFVCKPLIFGYDTIWADYNKSLIFFGLGVSFSTLQDVTKTQNKLSKRIWENTKYSKAFLIYTVLLILLFLFFGMYCLFITDNLNYKELSFGLIGMAIGMIGLLKGGVEMATLHQSKGPQISE